MHRMERPVIDITMLGGFSLTCGDVTISDKSGRAFKPWLLLAYLISNRSRSVSRDELMDLLGDRDRNTDPESALRAVRMRARRLVDPLAKAVGEELIVGVSGGYRWNPEVPIQLDVEEFESRLKQAETAGGPGKIELLVSALDLYRGPFLERLGWESWVAQLSAYFQEQYTKAVEEAVPLLNGQEWHTAAISLCRAAIKTSPFREELYRLLMESLKADGSYEAAHQVYIDLRETLLSELGVSPDEAIQQLDQDIQRLIQDPAISMEELRNRLREGRTPKGALLCDFSFFQLLYQVEARSADRRGDAVHIGVISVSGRDGPLAGHTLSLVMDQLGEQIQHTLRIGDVAACCSATQYVMLLVQANYENSQMVCRRVVDAFRRAHPRSPAVVTSSVLPLETVIARET